MPTISFTDLRAFTVFQSMAEGMAEVREDNDDTATAVSLRRLIAATDAGEFPRTVTLAAEIADAAAMVLENCLDNSSGMKPDDADASDYLFAGDVSIAP
jgi:hypothetical protein